MTQPDPIAVFFTTAMSRPAGRARLRRLLQPLGPDAVELALANLQALQKKHPALAVVSVRELFASAEARLRSRALSAFRAAGWLDPGFNSAPQGMPAAKRARVRYAGVFPGRFQAAEMTWLFAQMLAMQKTAAAVISQGLAISPSHIVLSAQQGDFMTITATDTDKSQLQLYGQTPLVTRRGPVFVYFGDPHYPPSSETVSHWHLHCALREGGARAWSHVLHFHHAGLRDAGTAGQALRAGNIKIPCIAQTAYGSSHQGLAAARTLLNSRATAVTIAGHGTWFVGQSLAAALKLAAKAVQAFSGSDKVAG